ncbi:protein phosphatase regulator [Botryosphaeria dothidea]
MAEVLPVQLPEGQSYFSPAPLRRSSPSQPSFLVTSPTYSSSPSRQPKYPTPDHNDYGSPIIVASPSPIQSPTNVDQSGRSTKYARSNDGSRFAQEIPSQEEEKDDDDDEGIAFPSYDIDGHQDDDSSSKADTYPVPSSGSDSVISTNTSSTPEPLPVSEDDSAIKAEPTRHVDYLSHDWREEDIWSSWRHITTNRRTYGQRSRLENASWRTWAKAKYRLRTVSPETLNWLKDCDVTWLYGPLQTSSYTPLTHPVSETGSNMLSKNNSFINKKPILKKRSMSEVMLQRSISNSSLIKQAATAVQAERSGAPALRSRPSYGRATSDYVTPSIPSKSTSREATDLTSRSTSGLQTPGDCERKHIRFDDKVEQCIAVECKDADDDFDDDSWTNEEDDDSSDDGLEIKTKPRRLSRNNSKTNFGAENKTIQKLPDTTLKYRTDSPDVPDHPPAHSLGFWRSSRLSPSPSQETLRPSRPTSNFLLGEDDDDDEEYSWEPSNTFSAQRNIVSFDQRLAQDDEGRGEGSESGGLRRTPSGMFMPYEEDEDDIVAAGLFGKVVDTVNTAKDIAHVIWNVGWRS